MRRGDETTGPFDVGQVADMIRAGALSGYLCEVGSQQWIEIAAHPTFAHVVRAAAPPPPPPNISKPAVAAKRKGFDPENLSGLNVIVLLLLFVVGGTGFVFLLSVLDSKGGSSATSESAEPKAPEYDKTSAWVMAQQFIKNNLVSPGSADFGGVFSGDFQRPDDHVEDLGGGSFIAKGWVDSQNSFGAKMRSDFVVKLKYVGGQRWQLEAPVELVQRE